MRYILTTFEYGCGLGPTQASRHLDVPIPEHVLRFINRRHISVEDLRAACTDLINLYAQRTILWSKKSGLSITSSSATP